MKEPCQAHFVQGSPKLSSFYRLTKKEKKIFSWSKGPIELKQGSRFEFVHCLDVYMKNKYQFGPLMDPGSRGGKNIFLSVIPV